MKLRIHTYLAQNGLASRRKLEKMIKASKIRVNGRVAGLGQIIDPDKDQISIDGNRYSPVPQEKIYYLIYKPKGYVSTVSDELNRPNVLELIPKSTLRLYPVGRLDIDSEGLMIVTNDGDLTYKLTHPKHKLEKEYEVTVEGRLSLSVIKSLERGVALRKGVTSPAKVKIIQLSAAATKFNITIHEGKNRQIRRMMKILGHDTTRLVRIRIGKLTTAHLKGKAYQRLDPHFAKESLMKLKLGLALEQYDLKSSG